MGETDRFRDLREFADLLHDIVVSVVAGDNLMRDMKLCEDETELAVTVRRLIEVHEVHINRVVRKLLICLRVQMKERLSELLQALDPHLGR